MGNFQITEAKLELMQKIIDAHLTEEELRDLTSFTKKLLNSRCEKSSPTLITVHPATSIEGVKK